jgi:hypothetical protein
MAFEDVARQLNLASVGVGVGRAIGAALDALSELHHDVGLSTEEKNKREEAIIAKVAQEHGLVVAKQGEAR